MEWSRRRFSDESAVGRANAPAILGGRPPRPGRSGRLPPEIRHIFAAHAAETARRLLSVGVDPRTSRVISEMRKDALGAWALRYFERAYDGPTVKRRAREAIRQALATTGASRRTPKRTLSWVRARLGQLGRVDLIEKYTDREIEWLVRQANDAKSDPVFSDDEVVVLWILREREVVPASAVDSETNRRNAARRTRRWVARARAAWAAARAGKIAVLPFDVGAVPEWQLDMIEAGLGTENRDDPA